MLSQVGVGDSLEAVWEGLVSFIPDLVAFLAILAVGYLVTKLVEKAVDSVLERVGFDSWVERGGVRRVLQRAEYDASTLLSRVVFYTVMLFVFQLAFSVFGPNQISFLINNVIAYLPKVFAAIVILVIAAAVAAAVRDVAATALGTLPYAGAVAHTAGGAIVAVGVFAALVQLDIAPAVVLGIFYALLAVVAGSAIIAIGGGGIAPMRQLLFDALERAREEAPMIRRELDRSPARRSATGPAGGQGAPGGAVEMDVEEERWGQRTG